MILQRSHLGMEYVKALVSQFHSEKGILPLDEEVLIQFQLQKSRTDEVILESIMTHFQEAKKAVLGCPKRCPKPKKSRGGFLEPDRNPTDDERVLYNFLLDYCKRNNLGEGWVGNWDIIRDTTDDDHLKKLLGLYVMGEIGMIPHRTRSVGGDRVLRDFRIYSSLKDSDKWDKFFCVGLSDDDLLRILIARYTLDYEKPDRPLTPRDDSIRSHRDEYSMNTRPKVTKPAYVRINTLKAKVKHGLHRQLEGEGASRTVNAIESVNTPHQRPQSATANCTRKRQESSLKYPLDIGEITRTVQASLERSRVCTEWLETGDCVMGRSCPKSHP